MADDFFAFLVKELEEFENIYNELLCKVSFHVKYIFQLDLFSEKS